MDTATGTPSANRPGTVMIALADPPQGRSTEELTHTVSPSRISTWQQCRLKFYFKYVAGIPKAPTPALHIGTTVHTVLQQWNLARWRKHPLDAEALKEVFLQAWSTEELEWEDEEAARQSTWRLLEAYFRETPIPGEERPEGVEVSVEADLGVHGLPTLIGVLDLVRAGGRIVDFKTAARSPAVEMLAHTSETQVTAYGLLYRESTGHQESGIELHHLVKTKMPKVVISAFEPISQGQITRLFHVIDAYVEGLERQDFIPSPGLQCASCEFFNQCRVWR